MEKDLHTLPKGEWIYVGNLPRNTTEETIAEFLVNSGLDTTVEHISVKEYEHVCSAIVSVTPVQLAVLINLLINEQKLGGRIPRAEAFR